MQKLYFSSTTAPNYSKQVTPLPGANAIIAYGTNDP